ncbi:DUF1697 domain-containing protein [Phenylobacterium sp.]|jgi:uncharacterized protein (DUF1697 family)|uniref:DUF1697 domain-containing protein n=1 Tax=Phenylobacterium sp. TaxID=1871053 RepID=UPI0037C52081
MSERRLALLLRAVNVGGRVLPMAALRSALGEAGLVQPETLLASGNALVTTARDVQAVEAVVETLLADRFGLSTDVMARDLPEIQGVLTACPFAAFADSHPNRLITFFTKSPGRGELSVLEDRRTAGEAVAWGPGCLYATFPAGSGTSKLTPDVIERRLGVRVTGRNWNTVRRLADLLENAL